jgi:hypothetical protein
LPMTNSHLSGNCSIFGSTLYDREDGFF